MNAPDNVKFQGLSKFLKGDAVACLNRFMIRYPHAKFVDFEEDFADISVEELYKSYAFREQGQHESVSD